MSQRKLRKAVKNFASVKGDREIEIPGILGFKIAGNDTVEVPNRDGYVYVRLRNNLNEVIQAYNDQVSPVYNLPVVLVRDSIDKTRYKVKGRDLGVYEAWGTSPYLPKHGNQHSFAPNLSGAGDIVWVYSRQFLPLLVRPSGTFGSPICYVEPYVFFDDNSGSWRYAGGENTPTLTTPKPTNNQARMLLVYLDNLGNIAISTGSSLFAENITGTSAILPFVPSPASDTIPLSGVRLLSGTSAIGWDNLYDLRPIHRLQP